MKTVVIIVAHPDDVEPQMGGSIIRHTEKNERVVIIQVTSPLYNGSINIRKKEAINAAQLLGAEIYFMDYNLDRLTSNREIIERIDELLNKYKPYRVYTCWGNDSHQEHQLVSKCVVAASRKNNFDLIFFEPIIPCGLTSYSFKPNMFVNISKYIDQKEMSIRAHQSQLAFFGEEWIEAARGRAKVNGFRINRLYAEAFEIVKLISED